MKARCSNLNHPQYKNYGGRGIKVCKRWHDSFENFLADVGYRPSPKHSLERMKNGKGYKPGNVTWSTNKKQSRNKRTNRFYTFQGKKLCLTDWAKKFSLKEPTLRHRLDVGWSLERALTTP